MSAYRDRRGQQIGKQTVVEDWGRTKRQANGGRRVVWRLVDSETGQCVFLHTADIIRRDRERLAREAAAAE